MTSVSQDLRDWPQAPESKHWIQRTVPYLVVLLLLIGMGFGAHSLLTDKASTKKPVTTVKIMLDKPPPPPPPPPKEQHSDKEIKIEQPRPQEAPQPPGDVLKMEGAAGTGSSPFAAGTVVNDYKGERIGGKGLAAYAWYTDQIKAHVEEALAGQKDLVKVQYRLNVRIWLARDGRVERAELQGSSGDASIDKLIRKALAGVGSIAEAPPEDMPQPVKLRITSKNSG